jgi:2-desacetyl-2-hydroxyethyl bacteriochlorophyllide A dehydrogenase
MRGGRLEVDDIPDPVPGTGQVLVRTLACGICGSDLHTLEHAHRMASMSRDVAASLPGDPMSLFGFDPDADMVMGHEFAVEVLEVGPDAAGVAPGDVVVSMPIVADERGIHAVGYSNNYPGGYAERLLLSAGMAVPVPNGLEPRRAALTEPMAVGVHAVGRSGAAPGHAAIVVGAGPIGLAVIAALRQAGVAPVVAADFSPRRRELAAHMGAHEVVDPRDEPAIEAWRRVDGMRPLVLFEAVGVPGMIEQAMADAPRGTEIVVVGVCMEPDRVQPFVGISKELTIRFALGYDPMEFGQALRAIAEGDVDVDPLITGVVPIEGVPQAFQDLADPEVHAKIVVEPQG